MQHTHMTIHVLHTVRGLRPIWHGSTRNVISHIGSLTTREDACPRRQSHRQKDV